MVVKCGSAKVKNYKNTKNRFQRSENLTTSCLNRIFKDLTTFHIFSSSNYGEIKIIDTLYIHFQVLGSKGSFYTKLLLWYDINMFASEGRKSYCI